MYRTDCMCPGCKQERDDMRKKNKTNVMKQTPGWSYAQLGSTMICCIAKDMETRQKKENKMIKVGDVVKVTDGSYSRSIINGTLTHEHLSFGTAEGKKYRVILLGCKFPAVCDMQEYSGEYCSSSYNNTVIQDVESDKVIFIEERFLRPTVHKIEIDGKTIELSEKSFQNLKEQLCPTS